MTEKELIDRVSEMAKVVHEAGGEPEVCVMSDAIEIEDGGGMREGVGGPGGMELHYVQTPYGLVQIIQDKWCSKDKFFVTDWATVEDGANSLDGG